MARRDDAAPFPAPRPDDAPSAPHSSPEQLGQVAHDLRAALNTIVGWAELVRSETLDAALRARAGETIVSYARQLARRVDEAMELWRVDAGAVRAACVPSQVTALLRNAVDQAAPVARARHVRWQIDTGPADAPVWCDPERFTQAMALLLTHAATHSPRHGVVSIEVTASPGRVDVTVRDSGAPLRADALALAFDEQLDSDDRPAMSSRGFDAGLLLARRLMELQGGAIVPLHDAAHGAGFAITVARVAERRTSAAGTPPLTGVRVLVVEDEPDAREALTALLRLHGAEVFAAGSVGEALVEADRHGIDLLLSDIAMPDRDGYELLRELRSHPRFAHLPAAALTAYAGAADRQRALAAGFQVHLAKPVEPDHLLSAVRSLASAAAH